jgi:Mrp family chromosome partitioning ATPase
MTQPTGESAVTPHRGTSRQAWLTARARNAVHRPVFIGAVGIGTFVSVLVTLVIVPLQARRAAAVSASRAARPDTSVFATAAVRARARLAAAESSLAQARSAASTSRAVPSMTTPTLMVKRDSLSSAAGNIDALLTRIETAPVAASYRALAQAPPLATVPRVRVLLDSLNELEREREAFGLPGGRDAEAATLAARVSEVGQTLQAIGRLERDSLRQLAATVGVSGDQPMAIAEPIADTVGWVAERDSARSMLAEAGSALVNARKRADDYDRDVARAHASAQANAPPVALLGAALIIGVVLGFGAAFFGEMRHPRISDEHEVERATGARVLATAQRRPRDPNRDRRLADRLAPPFFDPRAPSYQLAYLHVVRAGATRLSLTVTGDDTNIAAVVGMNVAAIAADEARSTILIDTDAQMLPLAAALRCHAEPGIADVIRSHIDWAEVTTQTMAGRDRTIDVIPSGISPTPLDGAALASLFRQESARLARHYEAIVLIATLDQAAAGVAGSLPVPDVIVCARVGHTRLADLRSALDAVRRGGGNPLGIVLWDSVPPPPLSAERVELTRRPLQTAEMQALTREL